MSADLVSILDFIVQVEQLKAVDRKTRPVGLDRYENSAEHSWHVCLAALMLKDHADEAIDIDRVIRMLLIHDLGEIDAGDKIIYSSETPEQKAAEARGVERLLAYLSDEQFEEYRALWLEFEAGETPDSRFARAIDRVPPLLHNLNGGGHSWKAHGVDAGQVFAINERIGQGSQALWKELRNQLQDAVDEGLLKP
ncbi:HD domain-containing protein [Marinospirillum perlucidum]|uniref:HD domain-containing protein n=1 Tax=Marinospirillum perlucidum TaxID=1982602 RepID=UPI001C49828E|nr:HD domain-containing protein [Marinospirillum perlucidum]